MNTREASLVISPFAYKYWLAWHCSKSCGCNYSGVLCAFHTTLLGRAAPKEEEKDLEHSVKQSIE